MSGSGLGGEKSGHVIVREHTTSGDGIVTALEVLRVMTRAGRPLADLRPIEMLPQQQRAIKARHKDQWEGDRVLQAAIADAGRRLGERVACSSGPRERNPPCGSWSRDRTRRSSGAGRHARDPRRGATKLAPVNPRADGSQERRLRPRSGRCRLGLNGDHCQCAASSDTPVPVRRARSSSKGLNGSSTAATTRRDRAGRRRGGPVRREARRQALEPPDGHRRPDAACRDRSGAHALGHAWAPQRPECPSPPGLHGRDHRHPQRDHRELPGSCATGWRRAATRSPRKPTPRRSRISSRSATRATSGMPHAPPPPTRGGLRARRHASRRDEPLDRRPPGRAAGRRRRGRRVIPRQ